jgi:threonine dehydrogenase-like Zn-dependent dehydrogenase
MRALVINSDHRLSLVEHPDNPPLETGEVRVRTALVGVCATDREIVRHGVIFKLPAGEDSLILGHEGSGTVAELSAPTDEFAVGDTVVPMTNPGRNRGIDCHGFFSDSFVERAENLLKVPDDLRDMAVLVEPITVPYHALRQANKARSAKTGQDWGTNPKVESQRVLVIGAGPIGILGALICRSWGYSTTVTDLLPEDNTRVQIVRDAGCEYVNNAQWDRWDQSEEFDIILHAAPVPEPILEHLPKLGRRGVLALVGWLGVEHKMTIDMGSLVREFVHNEQTISGTLGARVEDFRDALGVLRFVKDHPTLTPDRFISDIFQPEDYLRAFESNADDVVVAIDFREKRAR